MIDDWWLQEKRDGVDGGKDGQENENVKKIEMH
jgi:hypothetical protein